MNLGENNFGLPVQQNKEGVDEDFMNYAMISHEMEEDQPLEEEDAQQFKTEELNLQDCQKVEPLEERVRKSMIEKIQKKQVFWLEDKEIEYGEQEVMRFENVKCDCNPALKLPTLDGDFFMTNYKIIFKHQEMVFTMPNGQQRNFKFPGFLPEYLTIPYNLIQKTEKSMADKKIKDYNILEITTKDFRNLRFQFDSPDDCNNVQMKINLISFPENQMHEIFAFTYFYPVNDFKTEMLENGWDIYKAPEDEFKRQGIQFYKTNPEFRIFRNIEYKVCQSYPDLNVIPNSIGDHVLEACAKFRTKNRFPSLSYYDKTTCCSIWRSSQVMTGFSILSGRCYNDELMLQEISKTNLNNPNKLIIYDARPYINALASRVVNGGFENTKDHYTNCEIVFCNIDNIHSVRDALTKVYDLALNGYGQQNSKWFTMLDNTNWLQIISKILKGTNRVLETILIEKSNVLIHCTDGWDRTAQLCSLAQVMLDPYFRTIRGFQVLIEKDWLSFGHQFERRFGHYNKNYKDDQRCPIFIQFLDCVYQLLHQFTNQFEFNRDLLLFLAQEVYTCKYGTFLCNSQRERIKYNLHDKTVSIWTYINHFPDQFQNPFYEQDKQVQLHYIKETEYQNLKLWKELYFKFTNENILSNPFYSEFMIKNEYIQQSSEDQKDAQMREMKKNNNFLKSFVESSQELIKKIDQNTFAHKQPRPTQALPKYEESFEIIRRSEIGPKQHVNSTKQVKVCKAAANGDDSQNISLISDENDDETGNEREEYVVYDEDGIQYSASKLLDVSIKTQYIQ